MGKRTQLDAAGLLDAAGGTSAEHVWSQRVDALCLLPGLLTGLGLDAQSILASAGLAPTSLDNPENTIPFAAGAQLLAVSARASGLPHMGLLAGQGWTLQYMGLIGQLMKHSPTLGDALRSFAVYHRLDCQGGAVFLVESKEAASLGYVVHQPGLDGIEFVYDTVMACGWNFIRELIGPQSLLLKVVFARTRPSDMQPYRDYFRTRLQFDSDHTALYLPRRLLDQPVPGADAKLRREIESRLQSASAADLTVRLHRALRLLLLNGDVSGDHIAEQLAMHRRTLHRRLKARGTTFQQVLDDVRWDLSRQLLGLTMLPLDRVASATGYADTSTFVRAFRRWSGTTPARWREAQVRGK
jgi:AraC-like DNA-binding protein